MIKLIVGKKGSGKTKILVDRINEAARTTKGSVTYNIDHSVRLIDVERYNIEGYDAFYGMITGVLAGNYDITDLFIDGTLRIGGRNTDELAAMIEKIEALEVAKDVNIVFTVSCDKSELNGKLQGLAE